ncbi:MAG: thiamine-phosphate kinase [Chloroflexi bacterium]|nr:thiamine-phosphate kinase [Chloroflexota bacterium]
MPTVRVRDVGEIALINMLQEMVARGSSPPGDAAFALALGIGDDAAAWRTIEATELATTDTMVEGVHFRHAFSSWEDLGWKALAVNLSDIAAMGGLPLYALATLGLKPETEVEDVRSLYRGVLSACTEYGCYIAGGDIVRSPVTFITVALTGYTRGPVLTRHTARPGDVVAVTGYLGSSAAGLRALLQGVSLAAEPERRLHQAHIRPRPRLHEGQILAQQGVRAAMDISDGLVDDLSKMCTASGVGAIVYTDRIPVDSAVAQLFPGESLRLALNGGEDYELLFAGPEDVVSDVLPLLSPAASILGRIVEDHPGKVLLLDEAGKEVQIDQHGWDHFR